MFRRILQRKLLHSSLFRPRIARVPSESIILKSKCRDPSIFFHSTIRPVSYFAFEKSNFSYAIQKLFFSSQAQASSAGIVEVPLAQTGEGIADCELLRWFVKEGDIVEEFQQLCEVQSDKATIEITSRYKGKISRVRFVPGDIVKVGETLVEIILDGTHGDKVGFGVVVSPIETESQESFSQLGESPLSIENREKVLSTPVVRNLAKEYGVRLEDIPGTGKDGRVLKEDVLQYVTNKESLNDELSATSQATQIQEVDVMNVGSTRQDAAHLKAAAGQVPEDKIIPLRGFQRAMVKTMNMAAKVPHFHYLEEINVDSIVELRQAFQDATAGQGLKHTYLPFLIKSLSFALNEYPSINSVFNEEAYEINCKGSHNIGVAMATPYGLVVPNIKNVQSLSILEITKELQRLVQGASNNKLTSEDVSGGTITISNFGAIGGKFGSPLLNLPEVAIVAIGRIQKLPRFSDDGTVYPASIMNVTFGVDHRVIDGATVAKFCNQWKLLIEKPEHLLLYLR